MLDGKIDISSTTIEKATEALKNAVEPIVKPASEEFGLYLAENIKLWRVKRQIKNVKKVVENCKKAGFNPKQLNLKVLFPYLENVSLEEDEQMQDRWADLITNYVDPNVNLTLTVYPEILKQLSTPEVEALEFLFLNNHLSLYEANKTSLPDFISRQIGANLVRLGLLTENPILKDGAVLITLSITTFGKEFVKACTRFE